MFLGVCVCGGGEGVSMFPILGYLHREPSRGVAEPFLNQSFVHCPDLLGRVGASKVIWRSTVLNVKVKEIGQRKRWRLQYQVKNHDELSAKFLFLVVRKN